MLLDRDVLSPATVPDQELVVHRSREIEDFRAALSLLAEAPTDSFLVVAGPPGTGKTMIARDTLRRLRTQEIARPAYVDCWRDYGEHQVLYDLVDALDAAAGVVHRNSTPTTQLIEALHADPDRRRVVVLDEAEMVTDDAVFRTLRDAPQLDVVCIVNDTDELVEPRPDDVRATLEFATTLQFGRYSVKQVIAILSARIEHGIRDGIVRDRAIEQLAEAAGGDARLGIAALRAAADTAVEAARDVIGGDHVAPAVTNARRRLHRQRRDRLSAHQDTLLQLIGAADGPIAPGTLYEQYAAAVAEPKSKRTMRTYVSKMAHYGLVTVDGTSRDRRYAVDREGYVDPQLV